MGVVIGKGGWWKGRGGSEYDICVLTVFTHLQIVGEIDGVGDDVVRPGGEIHVSDGTTSQHLGQVVCRDTVSETGIEKGTL
jgi:hypothetical protein